MNSKFKVEWMHLDWFYNQILLFSSSAKSLTILVFDTMSFSLVRGEVRQTAILVLAMNSYSFFVFWFLTMVAS
jgi:hypothetical protein